MNLHDITQNIDKIAETFPSIKNVVFSGGECVTLGNQLYEAIKYTSEKGFNARIVTNAYWATNETNAYAILTKLKESGIHEINYSTGDDHQEWIPFDNIIHASIASRNLGINTLINVESHPNSNFGISNFINDNRISNYIGKKNR